MMQLLVEWVSYCGQLFSSLFVYDLLVNNKFPTTI